MSETGHFLNLGTSLRQPREDCTDVGAWLHGNDSQLILLVDPNEESLGCIVENSSSLRPVAVQSTSFEEAVTLLEEEVVGDQLISLGISHGAQRVEGSLELAVEGVAGLDNLLFDRISLLTSDSGAKRELSKVATNSDSR